MKTRKNNLKNLIAISSVALITATGPVFAQSSGQQNQGVRQSTESQALPSDQSAGTRMDEPAGAQADGKNWGWIGLIGLAGLFGLKRHSDVYDEGRRTQRPA